MKRALIYLLPLIVLVACNKVKRTSEKFSDAKIWKISSLIIDGKYPENNGLWDVDDEINIYDSVPKLIWTNDIENVDMHWQFSKRGKLFHLSLIGENCDNCNNLESNSLAVKAYRVSGTYEVIIKKKEEMKFVSTSLAHNGENSTVEITLVPFL